MNHSAAITARTGGPATALPYRADIDGLRAVAVSAVVLFHAFPGLLPGGFAGVDIFFVISGFLIGGILIDAHAANTFTYRDFYARRIRRLFPALAVVLVTVLAAGFLLQVPTDFRLLGKHVVAGAGFASNLVLLKEAGYFDTASALKPLLHLWSLGVEEQFYILCPLLLALAWRLRMPVLAMMAATGLASFLLGLSWLEGEPKKAFFHPAARFWELFAGIALAAAQRELPRYAQYLQAGGAQLLNAHAQRVHDALAGIGIALLVAGFAVLKEGREFPGYFALLPVSGTVLLIASGARSRVARLLLANRAMVFVGLISYPLYLWHWPLFAFARIHEGGNEPAAWLRAALALLAVLLAWLTWRLVETPLRHARKGLPATRILVIAMLVVAVLGGAVLATDGAAWRYPAPLRAVAALDYDGKEEARAGTCFMKTEQTHRDYAAACAQPVGVAAHPRVLLWGDSHAAHLYPGLSALAGVAPGFALLQFTSSGCPPVPGIVIASRPACRANNEFVLAQVRALQPDVVVLAGFWHQYTGRDEFERVEPAQVAAAAANLRAMGVARVVVVGQVPIWVGPQPQLMLRMWEEKHLLVDRTNDGLVPESLQADARLGAAIAGLADAGVKFVSPIDLFCRADGCMTFSGDDRREPVAFDYGHLTRSASLLLAGKIQAAFAAPRGNTTP